MLAVAVLSLSQLPACATVSQPREQPQQHLVALSIIDRETGQPLTVHHKDDRSFVAGQPASRYAIRVSNRTAGRVLVVLSVDGVNIVSGETAAVGQTGYVLDPWRTFDIAGWRKSDREIAAFEFAALADSYAARTGRPGNAGVIGMAAFLERPAVPPVVSRLPSPPILQDRFGANRFDEPRAQQGDEAAAKPAAPAAMTGANADSATAETESAPAPAALQSAPSEAKLGTAHGERERSLMRRVGFERLSSAPQQVVEIAYDSLPNLVRAGVIARAPQVGLPRAFPNDDDTRGFVPDPPRARR